MDFRELTEASEVFTPLKATPSFQIAQDEDEDVVRKIPHGLTAKKENRRKSYHHGATAHSRSNFDLSPLRAPLTAPRPNVLNSRPITEDNLSGIKRSLIAELQSVRGGKENDTPLLAKNMSPIQISGMEFNTISSPMTYKRRSSVIAPELESPANKYQKINKLFNADVSGQEPETNAEEEEDEKLSRIEPFAAEKESPSNSIIPTQEDEVQIDKILNSSAVTMTPCRLTEPVALSPETEQKSRVVDETVLLLDTSKSPEMDDSYAAESPLSQHSGSQLNDKFVDLGPIEEYEGFISPEKHIHMGSPSKKPFFTIGQVHEIQSDFKREVEKLEEHLKSKSSNIVKLNDQVNQHKNTIYKLEDEVESLVLQKKQILKENELLKVEHDIFKSDIASVEETVKMNEERMERNKFVIGKFKERVKDLDAVIQQKNTELKELHDEIESKSRAISLLNSRVSDYEKQAQHLATSLHEEKENAESSTQKIQEAESTIAALHTQLSAISFEKTEFSTQINHLQEQLNSTKDENETLRSRYESEKENLKVAEHRYQQLTTEIQSLKEVIGDLEAQIEMEKNFAESSVAEFQRILANTKKSLNLKDAIVTGLQGAVSTLRESNATLQTEVNSQKALLAQTQEELNESTELLTIRKAEVDELDTEVKTAKQEIEGLRQVVDQKNIHINELSNSLQEYVHSLEEKELVIRKMDLEVQKQEGEHLAELEAFHAEMSNVQGIVSNKSNELFKVKEEKDKLQRDHDLLKYELETIKEEAGDYDTRISNLKAKLQEYQIQVQQSDEVIKRVQEEKEQLEKDTDKRLQELAEDLYIQYSKKHEQKVQVLKKGYENKWQTKVFKAESETEKLRREIEGLNALLEKESQEKNEIIKLWDKFKEAEGTEH